MLFYDVRAKTAAYSELEIFVTLRVADRVALTAFQTLTQRMNYADIIRRLERRDYYRLAIVGEEDDPLTYGRDLVFNTAVFVNPNKETFTIDYPTRPLSAGDRYVALVYPKEGLYQENLLRRLAFDLGYDRVIAAGRAVAWTIELSPGTDPCYAEEILVAKSRAHGLLVNPHAERYEII